MRISIVIPCYNGARYLEKTINSIERQTIHPHEVILVDDGSTDQSKEIAEAHGLTLYENPRNMGIGFTRQRGVDEAQGDYVTFLSADDAYAPTFIEESTKKITPSVATFTDYHRCDSQLTPFETFTCPGYTSHKDFNRLVVEWALKKNMFVNFSTVVIPMSFFEKTKFKDNLRHGEDLIFLLDTLINNFKWARIPQPLLHYRIHPNQGTRKTRRSHNEWHLLWCYIHDRLLKLGVSAETITRFYNESHRRKYPSWRDRIARAIIHKASA